MRSTIVLGKIGGIAIGINYTWLIALALIAWSLAVGFFPEQFPGWEASSYWLAGVIAALLLFASVLAHELTHSFVAQRLGMRVHSIDLFIFGGVSNIAGEAKSARDELIIAGVGPLSSIVLAIVFGAIFFVLGGGNNPASAILFYLMIVNALLAAFNLIPGFPLDGGRVFRAAVWSLTHNFRQATRIATLAGKLIAYLFIFVGLYIAFTSSFLSGIWLVFIGWFLSEAASASYQEVTVQEVLRGVHVGDLMTTDPITVGLDTPLDRVVHDYVFRQNVRALPVVEDGRLVGLVTLEEIRAVPRERWGEVDAAAVMTPLDRLKVVEPKDDAGKALRALSEEDVNQLPVVDNGLLVGLLNRASLLRFLQVRQQLGYGLRP